MYPVISPAQSAADVTPCTCDISSFEYLTVPCNNYSYTFIHHYRLYWCPIYKTQGTKVKYKEITQALSEIKN